MNNLNVGDRVELIEKFRGREVGETGIVISIAKAGGVGIYGFILEMDECIGNYGRVILYPPDIIRKYEI